MADVPLLRIALLGLGDIAEKAYLPVMTAREDVQPVLCTRDRPTLHRLARQYRIADAYASPEDLIASRPDAVMVHAATAAHPELLRTILHADIPVFVDKPVADSLDATEELVTLARSRGVPLFVGFNRRYAPLVAKLKEQGQPQQISWHKNRVAQPGPARTFLFDDFIHVVDGLCFLGGPPDQGFSVHTQAENGVLNNVQVRWERRGCLMTGGMNRDSGLTEERIELYTPGHTWRIGELDAGSHYAAGKIERLGFGNWTPTLEKRGFTAMLDDWIAIVRGTEQPEGYLDGVLESHRICEQIIREVEAN